MNGVGGTVTAFVTLVIAITKFAHGAWIVVLLIPLIVLAFRTVHRHYDAVARALSLDHLREEPSLENLVMIPVGDVHLGVARAVRFAASLTPVFQGVYVEVDPLVTPRISERWAKVARGAPCGALSRYRSILDPFLDYIDRLRREDEHRVIMIVIPEFVPRRWWQHLLHNQTALMIKGALLFRPGVVVVDVPFHLPA